MPDGATPASRGTHVLAGREVAVLQRPADGIAFQLWPSASLLAVILTSSCTLEGKVVLELGAGCGAVGIRAGMEGASRVVVTDTKDAVAHLAANVAANDCGNVETDVLEWGSTTIPYSAGDFDVVLLSDCFYWEHLHQRLLDTLLLLTTCATVVYMAHEWRRQEVEKRFFDEVKKSFEVEEVERKGAIVVMRATRRQVDGGSVVPERESSVDKLLERIRLLENDLESIDGIDGEVDEENSQRIHFWPAEED